MLVLSIAGSILFQPTARALDCIQPVFAKIVERDVLDCFDEGLKTGEGDPVFCEMSAVVFDRTRLVLASDKTIPGAQRSAVFSFDYPGYGQIEGPLSYHRAAPFLSAIKYEDMTLTPDGAHVIATTGFDRVKKGSHEWDGYNTLMFWPVGKPDDVKLVAATSANGVSSSVSLNKKISRVLVSAQFPDGVPYFKVEGLAAIPGGQLLFGIREMGARYDDFIYTFKIVAISYQLTDGDLSLLGDFNLIYDFDPVSQPQTQHVSALSSIEYDAFHKRLYLLTSYETGAANEQYGEGFGDVGLGGYLWTLSLADLKARNPPTLVLKQPGRPLLFAHKPEGLTVLNENLVLVVHDDDRVLGRPNVENPETQFSRGAHQAAYSLVHVPGGQ